MRLVPLVAQVDDRRAQVRQFRFHRKPPEMHRGKPDRTLRLDRIVHVAAAMMPRYSFDDDEGDERVRRAVRSALARGLRTADFAAPGASTVGAKEIGNAVAAEFRK